MEAQVIDCSGAPVKSTRVYKVKSVSLSTALHVEEDRNGIYVLEGLPIEKWPEELRHLKRMTHPARPTGRVRKGMKEDADNRQSSNTLYVVETSATARK